MEDRWSLGPVFASEWMTGSRSIRVYLTRSGFVLALLVVLVAVWWSQNVSNPFPTIHDFADAGAAFYLGLVGTQIALVLLAAPAATAGAICLEKSRGTLTHLLVTDLTDPEIVLGKLAARLVPTLSLVLCALPVQFLASLLGGIDPYALLGSTLVTLGVAIFACSLALTISVWGKKTQEVLIATYIILLIWLLAYPTALGFGGVNFWIWKFDPFQLALAPYSDDPTSATWLDFAKFFGLMMVVSVVLVVVSVWRFRAVAARSDGPVREKVRRDWRIIRRFSPTLDDDPVLWREWHRVRPSRWTRTIWRIYFGVSALFNLISIVRSFIWGTHDVFTLLVIGLQVAIGLLLLTVDSATSLAEERARGSLDVLMTTPLSTRSIVWAKWRGAYRRVFGLTILPTIVTAFAVNRAYRTPAVAMCFGLILAYGAAITSLGLAMATWVPRLGRAVALSVGIYGLVTAGGFFLFYAGAAPSQWEGACAVVSPFYGPIFALDEFDNIAMGAWIGVLCAFGWGVFYFAVAGGLLLATIASFDRCMGRARDRPSQSGPRLRSTSKPTNREQAMEIATR